MAGGSIGAMVIQPLVGIIDQTFAGGRHISLLALWF